jgi:hypothetical protein
VAAAWAAKIAASGKPVIPTARAWSWINTATLPPQHYFFEQVKFAASAASPLPVYFATAGYRHSGRVMTA